MRPLNPPADIFEDDQRQEVLRAWLDQGMLSLSVCHVFPESYKQPQLSIWAMLLSDVFHHVVEAIVLETDSAREFVAGQLRLSFEEVLRSQRESRFGKLRDFSRSRKNLPDPDVSGDDTCTEIVRIILLPGSIRVLVLVGMWLPDQEESVWGNLLYDLAFMIGMSIDGNSAELLRDEIAEKLVSYMEKPSTNYSGKYYGSEEETRQPS